MAYKEKKDGFEQKVYELMLENGLPPENVDQLVVGFSGGADSTALLTVLHELGFRIRAVHLNHGLREGDADVDQAWCQKFCVQWEIPFQVAHLQILDQAIRKKGIEAAAREARLAFWQNHLTTNEMLVLGHHADDAIESFFLRLLRGSGTTGLAGMRVFRRLGMLPVLRPLLSVNRHEIEVYLRSKHVETWCEDKTNRDEEYLRNALRSRLVPFLDGFGAGLAGIRTAMNCVADDADYLEHEAALIPVETMTPLQFSQLHPAMQTRVLRRWLQQQLGYDFVPRKSAVKRLARTASAPTGERQLVPLGSGLTVAVFPQHLSLWNQDHDTNEDAPLPYTWCWEKKTTIHIAEMNLSLIAEEVEISHLTLAELCDFDPKREYFCRTSLQSELFIRGARRNDLILVDARRSAVRVFDILAQAGIPLHQRPKTPVLTDGDQLLWIPGIRRAAIGYAVLTEEGLLPSVVRFKCFAEGAC